MFQTSPLNITVPCFRIPSRRDEFFLVMCFATDEINENPYLLPNMTLMFSTLFVLCQHTLGILDILTSEQNNIMHFLNYICFKYEICYVGLTGPSWKTSLKLASYIRKPKVRMYDTE